MPIVLYSFKKTASGLIMFHGFMAPSSARAEKELQGHAGVCPQFGPAHRDGKTLDIEVEVDELPEFDEQSIEEFLELDDDEDDEEEDEEDDLEGEEE
jgi:hypothetical protein